MYYITDKTVTTIPANGAQTYENFQKLLENVSILGLLYKGWSYEALEAAFCGFYELYAGVYTDEYAQKYQSILISNGIKRLFANKGKLRELPSLVKKIRFKGDYLHWASADGKLHGVVYRGKE